MIQDFDHELAKTQTEAVEYMLRPESEGGALLAFDLGLGKTRTGLMFAREYGARVVLAVVPLQTADDWAKTVGQEYPALAARFIDSSATGKKNLAAFQWRQAGFYIVGQEYWERLAWTKELVKKKRADEKDKFRKVDSGMWGGEGFLFIYDECHRAANPESWTHRALMNLHSDVFKLGMSGTFMGDRFDGAYGASKWIWPHRTDLFYRNIYDWRARWAKVEYDHFKPRNQKVVGEKEESEFVSSLPCYIRMETDEPEPEEHDVWVDLYPESRRVYDELDEKMVAWIEDNPLVAEYSITKRARQRQVTLALPTLTFADDGELLEVSFADDAESAKIDAVFAELDGQGVTGDLCMGESILFLTDSQRFARLLTHRLNERYGDVAREWSGPISRPNRKLAKAAFIKGDIKYLVGVQAAMGTGTDGLQHASHIIGMMSRADRRINNEQGIGRLRRKGQKHQVHVLNFLARDTLDTGQYSAQMIAARAMQRILRSRHREELRNARNVRNTQSA